MFKRLLLRVNQKMDIAHYPPPLQNKTLSYDRVMPLYTVKLQKLGLSRTPVLWKKVMTCAKHLHVTARWFKGTYGIYIYHLMKEIEKTIASYIVAICNQFKTRYFKWDQDIIWKLNLHASSFLKLFIFFLANFFDIDNTLFLQLPASSTPLHLFVYSSLCGCRCFVLPSVAI